VKRLEEVVSRAGPIDGVLGFSQGAMLTGILCALQQSGELGFRFNFALLCGGFPPRDGDLFSRLSAQPLTTTSLHVLGSADKLVTPDKSELLLDRFANAQVYRHNGGHYLPSRRDDVAVYRRFLDQVMSSSSPPPPSSPPSSSSSSSSSSCTRSDAHALHECSSASPSSSDATKHTCSL
jgi:Serine hydrolase (FSH1)